MSMETAREAAARGAALLDAKRPGWRDRIDRDRLNLASECDCIVGQEFEEEAGDVGDPYLYGIEALGIDDPDDIVAWRSEVGHGFVASVWTILTGDGIREESPGTSATSWTDLRYAWLEILAPVEASA